MQQAGIKNHIAQPGGTESVGIAERQIPIIVVRGQSSRWQRALLHQGIVREIAVFRRAQEPVRFRRLGPVKAQRTEIVAKRNRNFGGNGDGRNAGDQSLDANCASASNCVMLAGL